MKLPLNPTSGNTLSWLAGAKQRIVRTTLTSIHMLRVDLLCFHLLTRHFSNFPLWSAPGSESSVKLKLSVPVVAHSDCSPLYERSGVRLQDSVQMCAGGQKDRDSCRGDSGGPLMGVEYADGEARWFSTGVVSFGPRACGTKGMPGVYARVAHFVPWILDTIAD